MKIGIMQPYFWPYLGYFQLIKAVDKFVVYDNIQYTKKGWINRNRYLCNGSDKYFTIALEKDSDFLDIRQRHVSKDFDRKKLKNQIEMAYKKAPYFQEVFPIFKECIDYTNNNLFEYILYALKNILKYLEINTEITISSDLDTNCGLKGKDRVLAICKELNGTHYINPVGGMELYQKEEFMENSIELSFIKMKDELSYKQFSSDFVSSLSILDVMMFNSREEIQKMLCEYTLI